jgi:hypothetical protein
LSRAIFTAIFTNRVRMQIRFDLELLCAKQRQTAPNAGFIAILQTASAPIARHPPVDGLHSIANKGIKSRSLSLTVATEGV